MDLRTRCLYKLAKKNKTDYEKAYESMHGHPVSDGTSWESIDRNVTESVDDFLRNINHKAKRELRKVPNYGANIGKGISKGGLNVGKGIYKSTKLLVNGAGNVASGVGNAIGTTGKVIAGGYALHKANKWAHSPEGQEALMAAGILERPPIDKKYLAATALASIVGGTLLGKAIFGKKEDKDKQRG